MNSKKVFFIMLGLVVLLGIGVIGVVVVGNSMMQKESEKLTQLKLEEQVLEEKQAALAKASSDIEQYADLEEIAGTVVPQDKDQARAVREIIKIANISGISISSITFPSSNLGTSIPKPAVTPEDSESEEAPAAPSTPAPPPISQAEPVPGITGVYALEMNITPDSNVPITYYQFIEFLERLENNRRTAQVTKVQITPLTFDQENPLINFNLTINVFVKP
jgi:hypothetical protein